MPEISPGNAERDSRQRRSRLARGRVGSPAVRAAACQFVAACLSTTAAADPLTLLKQPVPDVVPLLNRREVWRAFAEILIAAAGKDEDGKGHPYAAAAVGGEVRASTLGAATAQFPLLLVSDHFGWRMPLLICTVAGVVIAWLIWSFLPRRPNWFMELMREDGFDPDSPEPMGFQLNRILHKRSLWILSLAAAGIYLPVSVIGDLWGVSFFSIEAGLPDDQASLITTLVFIGFAIGGVVAGHWSDRIGHRKVLFSTGAISAASVSYTHLTLPTKA